MSFKNLKTTDDLHILLESALLENKPEFIDLILEQGISLEDFLSSRILQNLYNYDNVFEKR